MVRFFKNLCKYLQFGRAQRKCAKLNEKQQRDKYIVVNYGGCPLVINRPALRRLKQAGQINPYLKWGDLKAFQLKP